MTQIELFFRKEFWDFHVVSIIVSFSSHSPPFINFSSALQRIPNSESYGIEFLKIRHNAGKGDGDELFEYDQVCYPSFVCSTPR